MNRIEMTAETAMRQASSTAREYLREAVSAIDDTFGPGYAYAHPELVAAFLATAASDFRTAVWGSILQDSAEYLSSAIDGIPAAMRESTE